MSITSLPRCGFLIPLLLVAACTGDGLDPGGACSGLHDAVSCAANSACEVGGCASCDGGRAFQGCYPKGSAPDYLCPAIACAPACNALTTAADCAANPSCEVAGCPDCKGGKSFAGCYDKGTAPDLVCLAFCPNSCGQHTDEASCSTDAGCHSIFADAGTCDCNSPGCCMKFSQCVNGPALCTPPDDVLCDKVPPPCGGDFTVSYDASCYAGCVRKDAC